MNNKDKTFSLRQKQIVSSFSLPGPVIIYLMLTTASVVGILSLMNSHNKLQVTHSYTFRRLLGKTYIS